MSNVHCEHRPVGQAALPAAQGGRVHLVTTVDVTAPVARAVGDAFPRRARGVGRLTREVLPVDGGAERAAPIQVVGNHRADHAVARGQVIGWVQPCCERDGLGRRRWVVRAGPAARRARRRWARAAGVAAAAERRKSR